MSDVANTSLATGLVEYWELDETSGNRVGSHASISLTDNNTVGYTTGVIGNAASFVASNNEYLRSTDSALQVTTDISWAGFVKPEAAVTRLALWNTFSSSPGVAGLISTFEKNGSNFNFRFANYVGGSGKDHTFSTVFTVSELAHVVFTYDISAGTVKLYKNGSLVETVTGFSTSITSKSTATFGNDGNTGAGNYYNGTLDLMGLWGRLLTDAEALALYNSGSGIPYDAGGAPTVYNALALCNF